MGVNEITEFMVSVVGFIGFLAIAVYFVAFLFAGGTKLKSLAESQDKK